MFKIIYTVDIIAKGRLHCPRAIPQRLSSEGFWVSCGTFLKTSSDDCHTNVCKGSSDINPPLLDDSSVRWSRIRRAGSPSSLNPIWKTSNCKCTKGRWTDENQSTVRSEKRNAPLLSSESAAAGSPCVRRSSLYFTSTSWKKVVTTSLTVLHRSGRYTAKHTLRWRNQEKNEAKCFKKCPPDQFITKVFKALWEF